MAICGVLLLLVASATAQDRGASPADAPAVPSYGDHVDLSYYIDAKGAKRAIESRADWEIRRRHVLAHMQTVMGKLPVPEEPVPLDEVNILETVTVEADDTGGGFVRRKIRYHTDSPEATVSAYLFFPTGERLKRPAVLCLHQTTAIGKAEPAGLGGNPNLHYALHLARRGYVTLAPDYPSFGDYKYDFADDRYRSGTMKAIYDNIRAVDLLQALEEVDGGRIGVIGHSLGGHNAMFTAAFEPRIRVIVSNCGFTRFHKYYGGRLKGWTSNRYMPLIDRKYGNDPDRVPFDFPEIVASFAPRPFLASAPVRDDNFEVSGVRDCVAAAKPIYELYDRPENLQANYPESAHDFPPEAREVAYRFLDRHLKAEGGRQ
ncbi:MAG: alpha/beta fold hydrolase [Planctomycetes bacterium]|nr:alpha/beta fold hydrolase [Planctomycetota bacterium]